MPPSLAPPLRITIVTPASRGSRSGNRVTALRWAGLLRQLGHRVRLVTEWHDHPVDVLIAVHAIKSATAVLSCKRERPLARIVVLLAGTDIYPTFAPKWLSLLALSKADALITLQPLAVDVLPAAMRAKTRTIIQSASAVPGPRVQRFTAAVLAHLRPVKQPLLAVQALAHVPEDVDVELVLAGRRLIRAYSDEVERAVAATPRARWVGEITRQASKKLLATSHVCIVPSRSEGGANVVSESIAAGTPVLCTDIPGNLGLLGTDWPATFPVDDAVTLGTLWTKCATDAAFLDTLCRRTEALQPMVSVEREREQWRELFAELTA